MGFVTGSPNMSRKAARRRVSSLARAARRWARRASALSSIAAMRCCSSSGGSAMLIFFKCDGPKFSWALPVTKRLTCALNSKDCNQYFRNRRSETPSFDLNRIVLVFMHKGRCSSPTNALRVRKKPSASNEIPELAITKSPASTKKCWYFCLTSSGSRWRSVLLRSSTSSVVILATFNNLIPESLNCHRRTPGPS